MLLHARLRPDHGDRPHARQGSLSPRTGRGIWLCLLLVALVFGSCKKQPPTYRIFAGKEGYTHMISRGETLEGIADRYYGDSGLGKALGEYNGVDPTEPLQAGTTLLVPFDRSELEKIQTIHEAQVLYNKGTMLARTGQYEDAVYYLESAVAASPALIDAWYNLALVYTKLERFEKAQDILQKLVNSFPNEKTYHYGLGANLRGQDKPKDAVKRFEKAVDIDPGYKEARYALALTYEDLGRRKKAIREWRRYLDIDPDSTWSEEARLHLEKLERR